jgi:hypothetical protein
MVRRLALALALAALPSLARADIPPHPDSPDAHCTPAEQCPTGENCPYSFRPGDPDGDWKNEGAECRELMKSKGLELRCRNGGNYGGQQLFCPPGATGSWTAPGQRSPNPPPVAPETEQPGPAPDIKQPTPTPAPAAPEPPSKAGMCSLADRTDLGLLALLAAFSLPRRRR